MFFFILTPSLQSRRRLMKLMCVLTKIYDVFGEVFVPNYDLMMILVLVKNQKHSILFPLNFRFFLFLNILKLQLDLNDIVKKLEKDFDNKLLIIDLAQVRQVALHQAKSPYTEKKKSVNFSKSTVTNFHLKDNLIVASSEVALHNSN